MEPSEDALRGLLNAAPDALLAIDGDGLVVFVSDQAERLFGWSSHDLVGQQVEVLVPEASFARHVTDRAVFVDEPSTRPMGAGLQLSGRRKDGSTFPADISLSAITEPDGALLVLAAVRDITERLELEHVREQLVWATQEEQSRRLEGLGQLAGGVAHDFNNLLGVILNYCTLLSRRLTEPQDIADIGEVRLAAERAAALTRQLLGFARRDVAKPEPLDINEVVTTFSSLLERTLGEQIRLDLDLGPGPMVVHSDRHQLEQILLNLAVNSRDAMPMGGLLRIVTSGCADVAAVDAATVTCVRMDVIDTGLGMAADVASRAFEPFFTTKPLGKGTGLGLATVFGIVRQNHGEVTIESSIGRGTKVSVVLPLSEGAPAAVISPLAGLSLGHERILLVEDEGALRTTTSRILSDHGYDVVTAVDGLDALEVFERLGHAVDLVISDIAMPRMRGDEMARLLEARVPNIRVIFMSGYDSGGSSLNGRLLAKPLAEDDLLRTIREVLDG
jgi:PAS domain S-box-containing protein